MPEATRLGLVHADRALLESVQDALRDLAEARGDTLEVVDIHDLPQLDDAVLQLLRQECSTVVTVGEDAGRVVEAMAHRHHMANFITVGYQPGDDDGNITGITAEGVSAQELPGVMTERLRRTIEARTEGWFAPIRERLVAWNLRAALLPLLALVTALIIGAVFIAAFDPDIWAAFGQGVGNGLSAALRQVGRAYGALLEGAFGNPIGFVRGLGEFIATGDDAVLLSAIYPLTESLRMSTPYIFTGLAVALAFRCGLFNIGAEGQYFIGGLASTFVGYSLVGVPFLIHLPLAVLAGFAGGAVWGGISGWLKAQTGAHEVITTIMLNYIAFRLADFMLQIGGPMARPNDPRPLNPPGAPSPWLPPLFTPPARIPVDRGVFLGLFMIASVWYLLYKTSLGFEFRTVGSNPRAARTAGMNGGLSYIIVMLLSGGLAGLAGAHDILGVTRYMPNAFQSGYGFDAIAIALLGRNHPVGVLLAALLFGFLRSGAQRMQAFAGVPIDIVSILQGLIIIFIAAPEIIRALYRLRTAGEGTEVLTQGWGSA